METKAFKQKYISTLLDKFNTQPSNLMGKFQYLGHYGPESRKLVSYFYPVCVISMSHLIVCGADHWSAPGSPDVSRCQILSCHSPHRLLAPVWCLLPWRGLKITKLAKLSSSKSPGPARHLFVLMAGVKTTVLAMKLDLQSTGSSPDLQRWLIQGRQIQWSELGIWTWDISLTP